MTTDDTCRSATDPLLHEACAWIAQLRADGADTLPYPISPLQRRFRIGYFRTCVLMHALAQRGAWRIAFGADGAPYAQLVPEVAA